jgi:hypothetical protein
MSVMTFETHLAFDEGCVLFDRIGKLGKSWRLADEFSVAVEALPTGLIDHYCIGNLFLVANVRSQSAMTAFTRQAFMSQLLNHLYYIRMTCLAGVISAMSHWQVFYLGKRIATVPDLIIPAGRCDQLPDRDDDNNKHDEQGTQAVKMGQGGGFFHALGFLFYADDFPAQRPLTNGDQGD